MNEADLKILFVCMGNICRSPTAETVFSKKLTQRDLLHKIRRFAEFLQTTQASVIPYPYDGGEQGFEHELDLVEEASEGLMKFIHQKVHA